VIPAQAPGIRLHNLGASGHVRSRVITCSAFGKASTPGIHLSVDRMQIIIKVTLFLQHTRKLATLDLVGLGWPCSPLPAKYLVGLHNRCTYDLSFNQWATNARSPMIGTLAG
jgi:hypothetical protein